MQTFFQGFSQIKKGVIINKTHVVVSPQQFILCTRFDKKSSEFIVNKNVRIEIETFVQVLLVKPIKINCIYRTGYIIIEFRKGK